VNIDIVVNRDKLQSRQYNPSGTFRTGPGWGRRKLSQMFALCAACRLRWCVKSFIYQ